MIGPYSANQMDDFYAALARGEVKASGIMNLAQHLYVAQRCAPGSRVIDVCCGRGLALPLLFRHASEIRSYDGLDISPDNLAEASQRIEALQAMYGHPFPVRLLECDVSQPWPDQPGPADVIIYTAALEHLPREAGAASLTHAATTLAASGHLYLSTPNSPGPPPKLLQYGVHVYEWSADELIGAVEDAGMQVVESFGLLPPDAQSVHDGLAGRYGIGAAQWYARLQATVPAAVLQTVAAAALPELASELMLVCRRRR
jgi:SAM-dependent methyltransferase